jgi:hypothetical protein
LKTFTQPSLLRANPTPFPSLWCNFDLGKLREGEGTYDTWSYDSVPDLPLAELDGTFRYLSRTGIPYYNGHATFESYHKAFEEILSNAAANHVHLSNAFVNLMRDPILHNSIPSVTGCFFTLPDEYSPIRVGPVGDATHVHFYCDSQSCVLWDLYVHPTGAHCVIARWPDYFGPAFEEEEDEDNPPDNGPKAWFVAPSIEAFILRIWIENQVWYIEHSDYSQRLGRDIPPITPMIQAYINHYRNQ